jgi:hypothetical protein
MFEKIRFEFETNKNCKNLAFFGEKEFEDCTFNYIYIVEFDGKFNKTVLWVILGIILLIVLITVITCICCKCVCKKKKINSSYFQHNNMKEAQNEVIEVQIDLSKDK